MVWYNYFIIVYDMCTYLYNCNHLAYFNRYSILIKSIANHYSNVSEFDFLL